MAILATMAMATVATAFPFYINLAIPFSTELILHPTPSHATHRPVYAYTPQLSARSAISACPQWQCICIIHIQRSLISHMLTARCTSGSINYQLGWWVLWCNNFRRSLFRRINNEGGVGYATTLNVHQHMQVGECCQYLRCHQISLLQIRRWHPTKLQCNNQSGKKPRHRYMRTDS